MLGCNRPTTASVGGKEGGAEGRGRERIVVLVEQKHIYSRFTLMFEPKMILVHSDG